LLAVGGEKDARGCGITVPLDFLRASRCLRAASDKTLEGLEVQVIIVYAPGMHTRVSGLFRRTLLSL